MKNNIPKIRFKGFDEEWVEKSLEEDSFKIIAGGDIDNDRITESGKYPVLANALTNDGIIGYYDDFRIKAPAVTVTGRGDVGYAKAREINFTPIVRLLSITSNNNIYFLENTINNHKVLVESTGVPQLTVPQLKNYKIYFSSLKEQTKIGNFFHNLDKLIESKQKRYNKLQNIKKAMLEKMFPKNGATTPQIRFKGFGEEWVEKSLGDIGDVTKLAGFEFTEHIVYSNTGSIIALRGLNIKNGKLVLDDVKYIDQSNFNKLNRSKLFKNDIMLTYVGTVGEMAKIPENNRFYLAPNVARIRLKNDFIPDYIIQYMRTEKFYHKIILPLIATSSQPALSMENVRKFKIMFPLNVKEQTQIGEFFQKLDKLLSLQKQELEKLKNIKKAMLEKMFV